MPAAAKPRTIATIKTEIVLAKKSYVAAIAAAHVAHIAAYDSVDVARARFRTLSAELAALRAR